MDGASAILMLWFIVLGILFFPIPVLYRGNRMVDYAVGRRRQIRGLRPPQTLLMHTKGNLLADSLFAVALYSGVLPLLFADSPAAKQWAIGLALIVAAIATRHKFKAVQKNYEVNGVA